MGSSFRAALRRFFTGWAEGDEEVHANVPDVHQSLPQEVHQPPQAQESPPDVHQSPQAQESPPLEAHQSLPPPDVHQSPEAQESLDVRQPLSPEVDWAVLRPGFYDVKVEPGPDWDYGDQDKGEGTVLHITLDIAHWWAEEAWMELLEGLSGMGGWSPTRSAAVHWSDAPEEDKVLFYKCGDNGDMYDLCTCMQEEALECKFDKVRLHEAVHKFCAALKSLAINCDTRPDVGSYEQFLFKVQAIIDEEWGRYDQLLRAHEARALHERKRQRTGEDGTVTVEHDQKAKADDLAGVGCIGSECTGRVFLTKEEITQAVALPEY